MTDVFESNTGQPVLHLRSLASIDAISEAEWDHFSGTRSPFLRHRFLSALEHSQCTSAKSGWTPAHLEVLLDGDRVGVIPAYLKSHSMGEYVFDWAWADAYERYGMAYYPKLLMAVPFTPSMPVSGLRQPNCIRRWRMSPPH